MKPRHTCPVAARSQSRPAYKNQSLIPGDTFAMFHVMRRSTQIGRLVTAVFIAGFLFGIVSASAFSMPPADENNVNSRYTVESVELSGASESRLSKSLREEIQQYIGQRFSPEAFARLSGRVREELEARLVSPKLVKGSSPDSVRVVLDVMGRRVKVTTDQSRFAYHSQQGFTGDLIVSLVDANRQRLAFGLFSDGDTYIERTAGIKASYGYSLADGRIRPRFAFSTSHAQYDARTLAAAGPADLYRSVDSFQPTVTFVPWRGDEREELSVESGLRYQRFVLESPGPNRNVASHALVNTLRYRRVRGDVQNGRMAIDASYSLVNGISALGSDYNFDRQEARLVAEYDRGPSRLSFDGVAGALDGNAPLPDRFAAGNTRFLRGWNKYEIAPLGAGRVAAASVEYGHRLKGKFELACFVDTGSIWDKGGPSTLRNSLGGGLRTRDGFFLYVALPLRDGRVEPTLMTGATF